MNDLLIFFGGTAFFVWVSRHSLLNPLSHGFYRFFAWECILALVLVNYPMWTKTPFAPYQIASWLLLLISILLALHAFRLLCSIGQPNAERREPGLLSFERTSSLVTAGAYRYIRHPMYAALLFLAWGALLKDISVLSLVLAGGTSVAIYLTALRDEAECKRHFGAGYVEYIKTSKRFIPFVF
jgi:protein-S-isoprenylcysteine O-methyltransferase Ste14